MEDVTITEMDGILRVTLNTPEAKVLAIDEDEIAPYVRRDGNMVYVDIRKNRVNKTNMLMVCRKYHLTAKSE